MPIFTFKCVSCGEKRDIFLRPGESPGQCPDCGADLDKIFTGFSTKVVNLESKKAQDVYEDTVKYNKDALSELKQDLTGRERKEDD